MFVFADSGFAFQHINRTGGSSVKLVLADIAGAPDRCSVTWHADMECRFIGIKKRHSCCVDVDQLSIYTNVRNPFDRIVSVYHFRKSRGWYQNISFERFFWDYFTGDTVPNSPQERFITVGGVQPKNVICIKLEEAAWFWPDVFETHFGIRAELPKTNPSSHEAPMSYFSDEMIKRVLEKEKWVIERYYPELLG